MKQSADCTKSKLNYPAVSLSSLAVLVAALSSSCAGQQCENVWHNVAPASLGTGELLQ